MSAPELELPRRWHRYTLLKALGHEGIWSSFVAKQIEPPQAGLLVLRRAEAADLDVPFGQEAIFSIQLFRELRHPGIARLLTVESVGEAWILVSERAPGWSLQEILSRLPVDGRAVPWAAVVGVGRALCSVLAYAHAKADPEGRPWGFVASRERGLETRRVFVDAAGEVKLADLGLGALLESSRWSKGVAALHLSRAFYLAPEAVRGEVTTSAADMFCLGWMLWDLLSGRRLFAGASDFDTLKQLIAGAPPGALQLPGVPAALERLIAGCLARVPAARPSATEAGRELEALMAPQEARQALGRFVAGATKDLQEGLRAELVTWSRY